MTYNPFGRSVVLSYHLGIGRISSLVVEKRNTITPADEGHYEIQDPPGRVRPVALKLLQIT